MPRSSIASSPSSPGVSYNIFSQPTAFTFGSGDSDSFNYDSNTGRVTKYQFNIGASSASGTLTWNFNGTLAQNAIVDPFNAANQQTCNYHYDDLARIAGTQTTPGVDCGANVWQQYFTYDAFGNITKNVVSGPGTSFQPTYNLYNQFTLSGAQPPVSFDLNGNTTQDNVHGYSWDAEGKMLSVDANAVALVYDALGRMVEQTRGTSYTQIVYGLRGEKLALMTGNGQTQTLSKAFVALPAGAVAVYGSGGTLSYFRHPDWLGSGRISSDTGHNIVSDLAYAPFGETYAESGTPDRSFTGQNQDTLANGTTGLYDFLYREYALYGRWISPDPAGGGAVNVGNPQSWNRYAYVMNAPVLFTDPLGLAPPIVQCWWVDEDGAYHCTVTPDPFGNGHLEICSGYSGDPGDGGHFTGCQSVDFQGSPTRTPADGAANNSQKTCLPRSALTAAERAELNAASVYAHLFNRTVGFGMGASGAMNLIPEFHQFGFGGSISSMLMADSSGRTALVTTLTFNSANFGAGINGGIQFAVGHESLTPGWSASLSASGSAGGGLGAGFDLTNSGTLTLNFGLGLGAKLSATMSNLNISHTLPICQ